MNEPKRNRFHSICSYFAMFPESFVETWLDRLTKPGDLVLDPFCGRGTTPFQALLMDRRALACDVNPVAWCVTRAKTNAPDIAVVKRRITLLERGFEATDWEKERKALPKFFKKAYSPSTLRQILYLRTNLKWRQNITDGLISALVLGSLHGESNKSPSYLSNQMPHTISTKPAYSVRYWEKHGDVAPRRDTFALLRNMAEFRYQSSRPKGKAEVLRMDMRQLPRHTRNMRAPIKFVITSPPYLDVTNFEEDQWLRLWFLGGMNEVRSGQFSKDDRHSGTDGYWQFIADMWRVFGQVLAKDAQIVIRLGATRIRPDDLCKMLEASSSFSGRKTQLVSKEISTLRRRQTGSFLPNSKGCKVEVDCCFRMA